MRSYDFKLLNSDGALLSKFIGEGNSAMEAFEDAADKGAYMPAGIELNVIAQNCQSKLMIRFEAMIE